jgi:hypothetical protein
MSGILVGPKIPTRLADNPNKPGHGTCVAAKVIGKTVGLAKNANMVVTRMNTDEMINETWLDGLLKIHDAILAKGTRQGGTASAIVNLSIGGESRSIHAMSGWHEPMIEKMGECITYHLKRVC